LKYLPSAVLTELERDEEEAVKYDSRNTDQIMAATQQV